MKTPPTSAKKHRHLRRKRRTNWVKSTSPKNYPKQKYSPAIEDAKHKKERENAT